MLIDEAELQDLIWAAVPGIVAREAALNLTVSGISQNAKFYEPLLLM